MLQYTVETASVKDCPEIAALYLSAFQDDPIISGFDRKLSLETKLKYHTKRYQRGFAKAAFDGIHYFKAIDRSNG